MLTVEMDYLNVCVLILCQIAFWYVLFVSVLSLSNQFLSHRQYL